MRRRFEEPWQNLRVQEDLKKLYSFNKHCNVKFLSFLDFLLYLKIHIFYKTEVHFYLEIDFVTRISYFSFNSLTTMACVSQQGCYKSYLGLCLYNNSLSNPSYNRPDGHHPVSLNLRMLFYKYQSDFFETTLLKCLYH